MTNWSTSSILWTRHVTKLKTNCRTNKIVTSLLLMLWASRMTCSTSDRLRSKNSINASMSSSMRKRLLKLRKLVSKKPSSSQRLNWTTVLRAWMKSLQMRRRLVSFGFSDTKTSRRTIQTQTLNCSRLALSSKIRFSRSRTRKSSSTQPIGRFKFSRNRTSSSSTKLTKRLLKPKTSTVNSTRKKRS